MGKRIESFRGWFVDQHRKMIRCLTCCCTDEVEKETRIQMEAASISKINVNQQATSTSGLSIIDTAVTDLRMISLKTEKEEFAQNEDRFDAVDDMIDAVVRDAFLELEHEGAEELD